MKKSHVAFQMSVERLAERGQMYFWTFTFAEVLDIKDTRKRWNHLLTALQRRWPRMCGLRVFEMHKTHGLHVHLLTNQFIDVNIARAMATSVGWGRVHVERIPLEKAGYLGKYLSKDRPPCFKGWRLWAAFGKEWSATKVKNLEKQSSFARAWRFKQSLKGFDDMPYWERLSEVNGFFLWLIETERTVLESGELSDGNWVPPGGRWLNHGPSGQYEFEAWSELEFRKAPLDDDSDLREEASRKWGALLRWQKVGDS